MPHESPRKSWKRMRPTVVLASKLGASSPRSRPPGMAAAMKRRRWDSKQSGGFGEEAGGPWTTAVAVRGAAGPATRWHPSDTIGRFCTRDAGLSHVSPWRLEDAPGLTLQGLRALGVEGRGTERPGEPQGGESPGRAGCGGFAQPPWALHGSVRTLLRTHSRPAPYRGVE